MTDAPSLPAALAEDSFREFARVIVITNGKSEQLVFLGNPRDRVDKVSQEGRDQHDLQLGRRIMDWITENAPPSAA